MNRLVKDGLFLVVLALYPFHASAAGYRELQPLLGTWEGTLTCKKGGPRLLTAKFGKAMDGIVFSYRVGAADGSGVLLSAGGAGRFKTLVAVHGEEMLTRLSLDKVPAMLTVSDDESDEDSVGSDYFTFSAGMTQAIRFLGSAKLRGDRKTISYQVKTETPIGRDLCSGVLKKSRRKPAGPIS